MTLEEASRLAGTVVGILKPFVSRIEVAGSIRRKSKNPQDVDIVLIPKKDDEKGWELVSAALEEIGEVGERGKKQLFATVNGVNINIWRTTDESWGATLWFATGPRGYNIAYRRKAKENEMLFNQYGLFRRTTGEYIAGRTEEELFAILRPEGFKKPEERGL